MKFQFLLLLIITPFLNIFSQDKTIENFEIAIEADYINSPTLIPITVHHNNEKKYFLSDTESLYYATEIEFNEKIADSLKSIILRNFKNQEFNFNNPKALEAISFYKRNNIKEEEVLKVYRFIKRKNIIAALIKLSEQQKINSEGFSKYYSKRLIIKNQLFQNQNLNKSEKEFLEYLATNITADDIEIKHLVNIAQFDTSEIILNLWNENIKKEKENYKKLKLSENELVTKYITIPKKKYGTKYLIALFKYGISFYVSDLDGTTHFRGIK